MNEEELAKKIKVLQKGMEVITLNILGQAELIRQLNNRISELESKITAHLNSYNSHVM